MGRTKAPRGRHARPRFKGIMFLGMVLLIGGFAMLGYVGWQFLGTNWVSRQAQERIAADLREQWSTGQGQGAGNAHAPKRSAGLADASALIRIPAFGDDYVVPVLEGVGDEELASGYGHFPGTADPGEEGNYALAAHRVTHGEPLRYMPSLRPGDEVVVETRDAVYTYELDTNPNNLVVTFHEIWVTDALPDNPRPGGVEPEQSPGQKLITLTTCSELFHTDNRMIAFGHLVRTNPK